MRKTKKYSKRKVASRAKKRPFKRMDNRGAWESFWDRYCQL
jgi:hypothetical protein